MSSESKISRIHAFTKGNIQNAKIKTTSLWTQLVQLITGNTMWFVLFEICIFFLVWIAVYTWNPMKIADLYPAKIMVGFLVLIFMMISAAFYVQWKYQGEPHSPTEEKGKHPILKFFFRTGMILLVMVALVCWVQAIIKGLSWLLMMNVFNRLY